MSALLCPVSIEARFKNPTVGGVISPAFAHFGFENSVAGNVATSTVAAIHDSVERVRPGDKARYYRLMAEILQLGYTAEYDSIFSEIRTEMPLRDCALVGDILSMFASLGRSVDRLSTDERGMLPDRASFALRFQGFDSDDLYESKLATYARFLVADGRWEPMAEYFDRQHDFGNSRVPRLAAHQRMLTVWKPLWDSKVTGAWSDSNVLSIDQLRQVLAAWPDAMG